MRGPKAALIYRVATVGCSRGRRAAQGSSSVVGSAVQVGCCGCTPPPPLLLRRSGRLQLPLGLHLRHEPAHGVTQQRWSRGHGRRGDGRGDGRQPASSWAAPGVRWPLTRHRPSWRLPWTCLRAREGRRGLTPSAGLPRGSACDPATVAPAARHIAPCRLPRQSQQRQAVAPTLLLLPGVPFALPCEV